MHDYVVLLSVSLDSCRSVFSAVVGIVSARISSLPIPLRLVFFFFVFFFSFFLSFRFFLSFSLARSLPLFLYFSLSLFLRLCSPNLGMALVRRKFHRSVPVKRGLTGNRRRRLRTALFGVLAELSRQSTCEVRLRTQLHQQTSCWVSESSRQVHTARVSRKRRGSPA